MKDSGIEWIKEIPYEWETQKGKNVLNLMKRPCFNEDGVVTCFRDGQVTLRSNRREEGYTFADKEIGYQGIKEGDLVIHGMDGFAGAIGISDSDGKSSPVLNVCTPKKGNNTKFLMYYLRTLAAQDVFLALATGIRERSCDLRWNKIANLMFPIPSDDEQQRIADFLDRKCTQIDNTIEKEKQVIENMKTYKLSIITETVTKGLNTDVPMKDSGIEWLGQIPADWKIRRLRYIATCQNGISKAGEFFGSGYPFVSYGDVYKNIELPLSVDGLVESTDEERRTYSVEEGDIFFTRTSETIEEIGLTSVCMKTIQNASFAGFLIRVRPFIDVIYKGYAKYYFRSNSHRLFFVKEMNLVTRASLSQELLKKLPVLLPPIEEQKLIANYLNKKCIQIDHLIEKKQMLINKLIDYKKSLIYEAVTGKLEI